MRVPSMLWLLLGAFLILSLDAVVTVHFRSVHSQVILQYPSRSFIPSGEQYSFFSLPPFAFVTSYEF